jgi:asparagine synthase (glutamine-hydrolysing)
MCGIAGILDLRSGEAVSPDLLRRMADAQAHRGPDGEGYFVDGCLGLAHRRLAIIDPSPAGSQPMLSEDGQVAVVFNGTIFNFQELSRELRGLGHTFRSRCDTEVLVHGWEQWGEDLVARLNGHFAFAVWDGRRRRLSLVRDRFGTKPLYYAELGGLWLFASEIKAILAHPAYTMEVNHDALAEYFTFQNLFRYHTLFRGVHLLPPANIMTVDAPDGRHERHSFWDYDFNSPDELMTEEEAEHGIQTLFTNAVRRQLVADVPVGAYLSGGMDSASIVALAAPRLDHLYTFTCGWHMGAVEGVEATFDERIQAEVIADRYRTEHYEQVIGHSDVTWVLPDVIFHLEDLRLGMCYANYYISRLASKFVKVCLAGAGGDELFGGYPWRYYRMARSLNREEFFSNYYGYWQRLLLDEQRRDFFTPHAQRGMEDTDMKRVMQRVFTFREDLRFSRPEEHIANSLYFEAKTFLHGLLVLGDRLSMAHGLEERAPFLDNDLVEFAQRIPVRYKLRNLTNWITRDENIPQKGKDYFAQHDDGKNVLRKAMSVWMPPEITGRRKQGFSSPDESWYRGPNLGYVKKLLLSPDALCHAYIERAQIQRALEEHCARRINRRLLIWSLLSFEIWLRRFADGQDAQRIKEAFLPAGRSAAHGATPRRRATDYVDGYRGGEGRATGRPLPILGAEQEQTQGVSHERI